MKVNGPQAPEPIVCLVWLGNLTPRLGKLVFRSLKYLKKYKHIYKGGTTGA